jgi:GTP cyclohydrolase I
MDTKFVNVGSVVMMAKENKINMQIAGSQDIQFLKGTGNDQPVAYAKHSKSTYTTEFIPKFQDNSLIEDRNGQNYTHNDLDPRFEYKDREIIANKIIINKKNIEKLIRQLLLELGENPDREGLISTPRRIAEMYNEIFAGYSSDSELGVSFTEQTDLIIAKDIQFYSMCEHHMLPIYGKIHIAYIPSRKVFGISKLVRLVEKYAKRLQVQERLTKEIADELDSMGVKGVMVIAEGEHLCMKMRGVRNNSKIMTTTSKGIIKEQKEVRQDILAMLYNKS